MRRIRTVVAVGTMVTLGVIGTGSTALASGDGTGHGTPPPGLAKSTQCLKAHGAKVTKTGTDRYQIIVPSGKAAEVNRYCRPYLPPGGSIGAGGKPGGPTLTLRTGGAPVDAKLAKCLKAHGFDPGQVVTESGTSAPGSAPAGSAPPAGAPPVAVAGGTVSRSADGKVTVTTKGDPKAAAAFEACGVPAPGPELDSAAG